MITAAFAPVLPFERANNSGVYGPLSNTAAIVVLNPAVAGPPLMDVQTEDVTAFTQGGEVYVPRGSDLQAGDRLTYRARKYVLMGAANWDIDHPMTGYDFGWMIFAIQVDAAQLIADLLALRGQQITLIPAVGVITPKPGGGNDYAPAAPRSPQTFVLYNTKGFDGREDSQTDGGLSRKFQFQLIGAADAQIALGDKWEDDAFTYEVDSIDRSKPFNVTALVTAFLKVTGHSFG